MRSKCIFCIVAPLMALAMWFMFDYGLDGVDAKLELSSGENDWLSVDEQLNCVVKVEGFEENPDYCWATKDGYSPLCEVVKSNDAIPEELKDVVKVDAEGVHIFYKQYLRKAKSDHNGLLIPMLSRLESAVEFGLKFGSDANCQLFSENGMDNLLRIVANMIHFSYTRNIDDHLGARFSEPDTYKNSYIQRCEICDEYLYLPYSSDKKFLFNIGLGNHSGKAVYSWKNVSDPENNLEQYDEFFHLKEDEKYVNSMRFYVQATGYKEVCTANFPKCFVEGELGFYLPFRLLWPAFSNYPDNSRTDAANEYPPMLNPPNADKGCDYELIFADKDYKLLVKAKPKPNPNKEVNIGAPYDFDDDVTECDVMCAVCNSAWCFFKVGKTCNDACNGCNNCSGNPDSALQKKASPRRRGVNLERLIPRGGSLVSGRAAFRPGFHSNNDVGSSNWLSEPSLMSNRR